MVSCSVRSLQSSVSEDLLLQQGSLELQVARRSATAGQLWEKSLGALLGPCFGPLAEDFDLDAA